MDHSSGAAQKSAIADLATDTELSEAIGAGLVENHIFMKEAEVEKTENLSPEALREFYIYY
jgi:glutamine synthetase